MLLHVFWAAFFFVCQELELESLFPQIIGVLTVIIFRIIAVKFHLKSPILYSIKN